MPRNSGQRSPGQVQGVGFRFSTKQSADELGIKGS
ncbi:MAG: acylphosphatase [Alkalibacterium sp.]|nr:acylphosphatase [Alkalibacterium sp.]